MLNPFGLSTLIAGFSPEGKPQLFYTDPSGTYSEWQANATGRNSKVVREWLERHYVKASGSDVVKLALRALLELVEPGSKSIEIATVGQAGTSILSSGALDSLINEIEGEKDEAEKVKKETARLQAERALAAFCAYWFLVVSQVTGPAPYDSFSLKSGFNLIKLCAITDGKLLKVLAGNSSLVVVGIVAISSLFLLKEAVVAHGGYSARYRRLLQVCRAYHRYIPMVCFGRSYICKLTRYRTSAV